MHNKALHSDKIKLRRYAMQLYFAGELGRYGAKGFWLVRSESLQKQNR